MPVPENARTASSRVTFGFRAWMVPMLIESVLRPFLSKANRKSDDRGHQQKAEDDIDGMFRRCLVRGLALRNPDGDGFHLVIHGRKGQSGEEFAVGSRRHQADPDQHHRTDHEHEYRVVQEVHIDKPSDSWRFKTAPAGAISEFHDKARSAHDEAGKERRDGARSVKSGPQDSEYKTSRDERADIGLHTLQVDIELAADVVDEWDPQQAQQHHDAGRNSSKIY